MSTETHQPKKQKHYHTLEEVEKDINIALRRRDRWKRIVDTKNALVKTIPRDSGEFDDAELIRRLESDIEYLTGKISRIENTRLPKLKRVHAAMGTAPLGVPGHENPEVVLEAI